MTTNRDEKLTIRLTADELAALRAAAVERDEKPSTVARRAIKAFLAGIAVVLAVVGLSACGGTDEPTSVPVVTSAVSEPSEPAPVSSEADERAAMIADIKDRVKAGECFSFTFGADKSVPLERWAALESGETTIADLEAFQAELDTYPPGCSDGDERGFQGLRENIAGMIASLSR